VTIITIPCVFYHCESIFLALILRTNQEDMTMQPTTFSHSQVSAFVNPARILVATDLTDGDYLVPHAVAQAKASGACVMLIHAVLPANAFSMAAGCAPYPDEMMVDREVQLQLQGMARQIERQGVSCEIFFKHGFAAEVIAYKLKTTRAARLIMGTHGRGRLGQFALGSVAKELLGSVDVPVFVVGPHALDAADQATPRRILHPVSLIGDYKKSAEIAFELARTYNAQLTLLHVLAPDAEPTVNRERSLVWSEKALLALLANGQGLTTSIQARATHGNVVEEVLNAATQTNADWIVLGVDGGFQPLPLQNSTAYKVIAAADCPVLAIRHEPNNVKDKEPIEEVHFTAPIG